MEQAQSCVPYYSTCFGVFCVLSELLWHAVAFEEDSHVHLDAPRVSPDRALFISVSSLSSRQADRRLDRAHGRSSQSVCIVSRFVQRNLSRFRCFFVVFIRFHFFPDVPRRASLVPVCLAPRAKPGIFGGFVALWRYMAVFAAFVGFLSVFGIHTGQ